MQAKAEGKTHEQIGAEWGLSGERVRQIIDEAARDAQQAQGEQAQA